MDDVLYQRASFGTSGLRDRNRAFLWEGSNLTEQRNVRVNG